jgi:glycosyltransferase involved in cell wall biosynthesis
MNSHLQFKKLNVVIPLFGVSRGGGIRVIAELANGLAQRGHSIVLITPPIICFPFPLDKQVKLISRDKYKSKNRFLGKFKDYLFIYENAGISGDIVLSNYYTTFFLGWMLKFFKGKKHVYFIQGYEPDFFDLKQSFSNRIKSNFAKLTYVIKPDLRITISQFIKNKIGKNDLIIINDGIDPKIFRKNIDKERSSSEMVICTIALDIKRKGFYDFIKAIEILKSKRNDFKILLFSSQHDIKLDLSFPYSIIFPSNDLEIVECLQKCDIFVSASHLEGFGLPGLEAMGCGAALVTSNSGGVTQYAVNEVNSLVFDVEDVDALVVALERLLDNPSLYDNIVQEGILTAEKFTWENMCQNFERELSQL